jgi:hypothetical protein
LCQEFQHANGLSHPLVAGRILEHASRDAILCDDHRTLRLIDLREKISGAVLQVGN